MTFPEFDLGFRRGAKRGRAEKMTNFVVFGIPDDSQLYLVDIRAGAVSPLNVPTGSDLGMADQLRNSGAAVIKGVNLAVTIGSAASAGSGRMDDTPAGSRMDENPASSRMDE
jgi:hypothetical protein